MHMKRTLIIGTALAALLLSGCEALQEERQNFLDREEKITNVVGNVWRIEAVWPGHVEGNRLADHLHERARMHCDRQHMAMLPVNGSSTNGEQDGMEGCLSVPGRYGMVKRPEFVRLRAQDRDGNWFEAEGEGLTARCFAHECDHLDGHIYTERAYHMLTDEEMAELEEEA